MKFATQARANVPGTQAQAVIVDATETVPGFPVYTLRWLDEAGETHTGTCGEGDLAKANPRDEDIMQAASAEVEADKKFQAHVLAEVNRRLRAARRTRASLRKQKSAPKHKR